MSHPRKVLAGQRSTTVVVADGNRMNCQLLVDAIQRHNQFQVLGSAINSKGLLSVVSDRKPDVAVLSVSLQDGPLAGLLSMPELRASHPRTRVIALLDGQRHAFCQLTAPEKERHTSSLPDSFDGVG